MGNLSRARSRANYCRLSGGNERRMIVPSRGIVPSDCCRAAPSFFYPSIHSLIPSPSPSRPRRAERARIMQYQVTHRFAHVRELSVERCEWDSPIENRCSPRAIATGSSGRGHLICLEKRKRKTGRDSEIRRADKDKYYCHRASVAVVASVEVRREVIYSARPTSPKETSVKPVTCSDGKHPPLKLQSPRDEFNQAGRTG